jgi:polar amino acid transport system substrate-binding protein
MTSVSHGNLRLAGVFRVPGTGISIGLAKDSPLTEPVRAALASLIKDGTYAKILAKWDMAYGAVSAARANQAILASQAP